MYSVVILVFIKPFPRAFYGTGPVADPGFDLRKGAWTLSTGVGVWGSLKVLTVEV